VVAVTGALADTKEQIDGRVVAGAATITTEDGQMIYRYALIDRLSEMGTTADSSRRQAAFLTALSALEREIGYTAGELYFAKHNFTEDHPEVKRLEKRLEDVRKEIEGLQKAIAER
jgi:hypothetical protein